MNETPPTNSENPASRQAEQWIEVDPTYFNTSEHGAFRATLLINRCKQLKRGVKRIRDAVTLEGNTQDECDVAVARYVERPNVILLDPPVPEVK